MDTEVKFYGDTKITFIGHFKSKTSRWIRFKIFEPDSEVGVELCIFNPPDHLVQYLYTLNIPRWDEVSCEANHVHTPATAERALRESEEAEGFDGISG